MPLGNPIRKQNESRMVSVLATEGQTVFTVQGGYIVNQISVFRNGVRLSNAEDFTAGDGSTVTLNNAANIDDRIDFHIFDRFTVQNAIVSAASTQTISGDVVVNGKIFGNLDVPQINVASGIVTTHDLNVSGVGTFTDKLHLLDGDKLHLGGAAGDNGDLQLFHDGSNSYIEDSGTGNLFIESDSSVILRNDGGGVDFAKFINGGGVELYHNNVERLTTTYSGADITGTLNVTGVSTFTDDITFTGAASNIIFDKSDNALEFTDDAKATFGTGADCTLTHSGSDFAITETTGNINLLCNSSGNIHLRHNSESMLRAITNDTVEIYYNNSKRLHTTPSGVDVTGTLNVTGVSTFTGDVNLGSGGVVAGDTIAVHSGDSDTKIRFATVDTVSVETAGTERVRINSSGLIGIGTNNPLNSAAGARVNIYFKDETTYDSTTNRANGLIINNTASGGYSSLELAQRTASGNTYGSAIINAVDPADGNQYGADLTFQTRATGSGNYGERMRLTSDGKIGINTTAAYSLLTAYGENKSDSGSATGQITAKDNAAYNANPTGGIIFMGNYHSNGAQAVFAGITGLKEDSTDGTYNGALAFHSRAHGAVAAERMRIDSGGRVLIGTTSPLSFNGVGQYHNLIVAGTWSDTDITDNSHAAITISNKDGTANNTAGLHFAREDTDGNPHYGGASVVAQFQDTMVTGQYPKADLAFLTSTAANNAPSQKMRLKASGEVLSTSQFISKTTAEYNANVSTASGFTADAYNVVLAQDVLDNHSVYIVNFSWNHQGSGQPYLIDGAFVFQPGATNPGSAGAMGPTFTPIQGAHTEQGTSKYFKFRYYSPTGTHVHGLQAASTVSLNDVNGNGILQIKIFKIGAETTI